MARTTPTGRSQASAPRKAGVDLRAVHDLEAAYAPYAIRDKLIFVARRDGQYAFRGERDGARTVVEISAR